MKQPVQLISMEALLKLWRLHRRHEPVRNDATVVQRSGIDTDALLRGRIHAWYVNHLLNAPVADLPYTEMAQSVIMTRTVTGAGHIALPSGCVRVLHVMVSGWQRCATISTADTTLGRRQHSPYLRGGAVSPVAVVCPGSVSLFTPPEGDSRLLSLQCAIIPTNDIYPVTPAMLHDLITNTPFNP